jgi:hypothetical protein
VDNLSIMAFLTNYATTSSIGMVQIGANINVDSNGVISTSGGGAGSISGTWTPTVTSSLGGIITLTVATANYVKNGKQVNCYFDFVILSETSGGATGTLTLNGLPFISVNGTGIVGTALVNYIENFTTSQTFITGTIAGSATQVLLWETHQASTSERLTKDDIKPTTRLAGTITYQSAT